MISPRAPWGFVSAASMLTVMGCSVGPASASRDEFSRCVAHYGRSSESHLAGGRLVARLWLKPTGRVNLSPVLNRPQNPDSGQSYLNHRSPGISPNNQRRLRSSCGQRLPDVHSLLRPCLSRPANLALTLNNQPLRTSLPSDPNYWAAAKDRGQMQRRGGLRARPAAISCSLTVVASSAFILSSAAAGASHDRG